MATLRTQATALLDAMPEEKLTQIIEYMQNIHTVTGAKKNKRNIDLSKYAGSAKNVFGKFVDVDAYIKEMRDNDRF